MTYNEWRDELNNNLLSVSDAERRRVLDYYAEAYADRREAGFSEREIIADFGAPYDAAQRILYENDDENGFEPRRTSHYGDREENRRDSRRDERRNDRRDRDYRDDYYEPRQDYPYEPQPQGGAKTAKKREDYTWLFVLLCVIFAIPLFALVMTMVGVTIGLSVAPFGILIAGFAEVGAGVGTLFSSVSGGLMRIGLGLIRAGVGIALIPLCVWLVKMMWKLFKMFFRWVRRLFSGKEGL